MMKRVIALGFFDGVHLGHAVLLQKTRARANELGAAAAAMSFDTHPDTLVFGCEVPLINTAAERQLLMRRLYGIDEIILAHFDKNMMHMPWRDFITDFLIGKLHACHVVCGHDFRFGDRGTGTPALLQETCLALGVGCDVIEKVELDGTVVSSTYIRQLLLGGEASRAVRFLGHRHLVHGTVIHGAHNGRSIGFPTANISFAPGVLVPKRGVYLAEAEVEGRCWPALVNVGVHPTAGALAQPVLEAWLQGFDGDLYGRELSVWLAAFTRPERPFSSMQALRGQLARDKKDLEAYFKQ